jgi:hypothetical protein
MGGLDMHQEPCGSLCIMLGIGDQRKNKQAVVCLSAESPGHCIGGVRADNRPCTFQIAEAKKSHSPDLVAIERQVVEGVEGVEDVSNSESRSVVA